jgi:hypothetical protein
MFDPEMAGKMFCCPDCCIPVTSDAFIDRNGNELHVMQRREKADQQQKQSGAVLASTESNGDSIPRDDHSTGFYQTRDPGFDILNKMSTAEVMTSIPLEYDCRSGTPEAYR